MISLTAKLMTALPISKTHTIIQDLVLSANKQPCSVAGSNFAKRYSYRVPRDLTNNEIIGTKPFKLC